MNADTKKALFIAGAAIVAGGASLPAISVLGGKTLNVGGPKIGPWVAPVGVTIVGGAIVAAFHDGNPVATGVGAALAAIGAYSCVATWQANSAVAQAQATAGRGHSQSSLVGGRGHSQSSLMTMASGLPSDVPQSAPQSFARSTAQRSMTGAMPPGVQRRYG